MMRLRAEWHAVLEMEQAAQKQPEKPHAFSCHQRFGKEEGLEEQQHVKRTQWAASEAMVAEADVVE